MYFEVIRQNLDLKGLGAVMFPTYHYVYGSLFWQFGALVAWLGFCLTDDPVVVFGMLKLVFALIGLVPILLVRWLELTLRQEQLVIPYAGLVVFVSTCYLTWLLSDSLIDLKDDKVLYFSAAMRDHLAPGVALRTRRPLQIDSALVGNGSLIKYIVHRRGM